MKNTGEKNGGKAGETKSESSILIRLDLGLKTDFQIACLRNQKKMTEVLKELAEKYVKENQEWYKEQPMKPSPMAKKKQ